MLPARVTAPHALAVLNPRSLNIANVSLGSTGLLQPTPESVIFLGHIYPYSALSGVPEPLPGNAELFADLTNPDPVRLLSLLGIGEVGMRALYLHMHWLLEDQSQALRLSPAQVSALYAERNQYLIIDRGWRIRRIHRRLDQSTDHWLFQGHLPMRKSRPDVKWRGHYDVPVHRFLWPVYKQAVPLRPEDRLRKRDICPDAFFRDCVNPEHFEIAIPMSEGRAIPPGFQNTNRSGYTTYRYEWNSNNVWSHDGGPPLVHCPEGHIMSTGVQESLLAQRNPESSRHTLDPHGRSICMLCYERYRQQVGVRPDGHTLNRRARGIAKPDATQREIKEDEDIARMLQRDAEAGRSLPTVYAPGMDTSVEYDVTGRPMRPDA